MTSATIADNLGDDGSDEEMLKDFATNYPRESVSSGSDSISDSSSIGFNVEARTSSVSHSSSDSASAEFADNDVEPDVSNTGNNTNTKDYDLHKAFSSQFYSDSALTVWPLYIN